MRKTIATQTATSGSRYVILPPILGVLTQHVNVMARFHSTFSERKYPQDPGAREAKQLPPNPYIGRVCSMFLLTGILHFVALFVTRFLCYLSELEVN